MKANTMTSSDQRAITSNFEMKLTVGSIPQSKVIVVSHERSGTHFLMNSLALNFGYVSQPWINVDFELGVNFFSPVAFKGFLQLLKNHQVRNILKSHHDASFYRDIAEFVLQEFRVIYIYRDVYSTLSSYSNLLNCLDWNEGPRTQCLNDFITSIPSGASTRYQGKSALNMVDRWCNHINGWLDLAESVEWNRILFLDYADLDSRFSESLLRLSSFLEVPMPGSVRSPSMNSNVINPSGIQMVRTNHKQRYGTRELDFVARSAGKTLDRLAMLSLSTGPSALGTFTYCACPHPV